MGARALTPAHRRRPAQKVTQLLVAEAVKGVLDQPIGACLPGDAKAQRLQNPEIIRAGRSACSSLARTARARLLKSTDEGDPDLTGDFRGSSAPCRLRAAAAVDRAPACG